MTMKNRKKRKPNRKLTYPMLRAIAAGYENMQSLKRGDIHAYKLIHKHGKAEEFCAHMPDIEFIAQKKLTTWTIERLEAEARKYSKRMDFKRANEVAYKSAMRRGLLDAICAHMPKRANRRVFIAKYAHRYNLQNAMVAA